LVEKDPEAIKMVYSNGRVGYLPSQPNSPFKPKHVPVGSTMDFLDESYTLVVTPTPSASLHNDHAYKR
jgi:hypothetical protein